jgi:protein-S-isoprenylcysteine O-methyltransferase Ste14
MLDLAKVDLRATCGVIKNGIHRRILQPLRFGYLAVRTAAEALQSQPRFVDVWSILLERASGPKASWAMVSPLSAMRWLWIVWFVSWLLAARWSNATEARPSVASELLYRAVTIVGVAFLFLRGPYVEGVPKLWDTPRVVSWGLVGLAAVGFAFCWWARLHLGRMWSSSVTRKADHHIVDTGPYALVRHPIYTGIIIAAAAVAAQVATLLAPAGLALLVLGFWIKARLEERFLREQLGREAYDAYARRTGMLFPRLHSLSARASYEE